MNRTNIRRGEIYLANLEPIIGSEQGGLRPVLIIQNNKGNKHSGTTIAAPITTKRIPNRLPVHVFTFAGQSGLPQNSCCLTRKTRKFDTQNTKNKPPKNVKSAAKTFIQMAL